MAWRIKANSHAERTGERVPVANAISFSDPDLRSWESLGAGGTTEVEWAG